MTAVTRATGIVGYANRMSRVQPSAIRELLRLGTDPDIISFGGGYPDPALFPIEELRLVYADLLTPAHAAALQYTASNGLPRLRAQVAERLSRDGMPATADDVLIIQGGQQGLDLAAKLVINFGDVIITEDPTFLGALIAFAPTEPRYAPVRSDADGMDTDHLAEVLAAEPDAKMIYVVPDFANPTGETLNRTQREAVLDLAGELDIAVIEDAAYRALRYDGEGEPPILALDCERSGGIDNARTLYCGSFSKILSPGMRVGWVCAPRRVVERLVLMKQASDLHSPSINQLVMHRVSEAVYDGQVEKLIGAYRGRRDALLAALEAEMPDGVSWSRPEGGMFVWLTLPEGSDATALLARSVKEARVAFVPGNAFYADGSGRNTMRMSFTLADDRAVGEGVPRLARLMKS